MIKLPASIVKAFLAIVLFCLFVNYRSGAQSLPYKNASLPVPERVKDLLGRMTAEEKFWQLFMIPGELEPGKEDQYRHGIFGFQVSAKGSSGDASGQLLTYQASESGLALAKKINSIQRYFVERSRLGIPIIAFDEALHGLVRDGATSFPQAIGLAATFDTSLMRRVAEAIATETKMRGIRQILTPVVNIASDVRWGRTEETYGEDPYLSSEMGVAFVSAFENRNIVTTPKHFLANVGDGGRDSYPIHLSERYLEEIHLPPFRACIQRGGSRSVMTAYNSIEGSPATASDWLLNKKLKQEWGFKGFVISDASAVGGANVLHFTAPDYPQAGQRAITNGLDVIFQTAYDHHTLFIPPFLNDSISDERIDDAVSRVLTAKFELGLFENPYVPENAKAFDDLVHRHKRLAMEAAVQSMVLLKNEHDRLPLTGIRSMTVIGEDAQEARLGGYSGPGVRKVSVLDGIRARAGKDVNVKFAIGSGRESTEWVVVPASAFSASQDGRVTPGLIGNYYDNPQFRGKPVLTRVDKQLNFHWTLFSPHPSLAADHYAVRWTGKITAPVSGRIKLGLRGNDGFRLYINDSLVVDRWNKISFSTDMAELLVQKGKQYDLRVEFFELAGNAHCQLIWQISRQDVVEEQIAQAVALARGTDIAVIVAGIEEGEFRDRAMLTLPGRQEEMIRRVAASGKPVIVVLVGGSAITMSSWLDSVDAVLNVWYPGEEGGHAVASVLFGDESPAGRLPITYPIHEAQLPLVYNHKPTGRGDDYNNLSGEPLFPFGFGLTYSQFTYANIRAERSVISSGDSVKVYVDITNTGKRKSGEVVQLYVRDVLSSVARPVIELKGFQRISLLPGEKRTVEFNLGPEVFEMLNEAMERVVEPGEFRIAVGSSSRDLWLKTTITVAK